MDTKQLPLLASISYMTGFPIYLLQEQELLYHEELFQMLPPELQYNIFEADQAFYDIFQSLDIPEDAIYQETSMIHYGICQLQEHLLCIIGPVTSHDAHSQDIHDYLHAHHIATGNNYVIHKDSRRKTQTILSIVSYILTGQYALPFFISQSKANQIRKSFQEHGAENHPLQDTLMEYNLNNSEQNIHHIPYNTERAITEAISHGDLESLIRYLHTNSSYDYSLGHMASTTSKQEEYQAVVSLTLFSRAAITGGVDPFVVYDVCDLYLQKISNAKTSDEYTVLTTQALVQYCNLVKRTMSSRSTSYHIDKCKYYIQNHLNADFSVEDVAKEIGLSSKYLGNLFAQTEGISLKSYIVQTRIDAAKNLLKYSDKTISEIAFYLCFSTQSHFTATFRRLEGTTPAKYRQKNKPLSF